MGRVHETVKTVNSAARTVLLAILVGGAALVGWKGYDLYNQPQALLAERQRQLQNVQSQLVASQRDLEAKTAEAAELAKHNERLQASVKLLKLRHRIARLRVVDQQPLPDSDRVLTTVEFFEVNDEGAPLSSDPQRFEIEGDRVYVECLVAKFEDRYVEAADLDRATAICLFQRLFGEYQQPDEGYELDQVGTSPTSYARGGELSPFEEQIWEDFWNIANNPERAAELGIRAAHADAPSIRVRPHSEYELELRSTGEFTLRPLP